MIRFSFTIAINNSLRQINLYNCIFCVYIELLQFVRPIITKHVFMGSASDLSYGSDVAATLLFDNGCLIINFKPHCHTKWKLSVHIVWYN